MKRNFISLVCFLSLAMFSGSCKDQNPYPIPSYYSVDITLTPGQGLDVDLTIGRVKTFPTASQVQYQGFKGFRGAAGYMGIVVYRSTVDDFLVYDMACPNDHYYGCTVIEHSVGAQSFPDGLHFQCSCCKAKFDILTGYPQGKTYKYPMRKYNVKITEQSAGGFPSKIWIHN